MSGWRCAWPRATGHPPGDRDPAHGDLPGGDQLYRPALPPPASRFSSSAAVALYGMLAVLVAMGYALLIAGLSLVAGRVVGARQPARPRPDLLHPGPGSFSPLRARLQRTIDTMFFRGVQPPTRSACGTFSGELTRAVDLNGILTRPAPVHHRGADAQPPAHLHPGSAQRDLLGRRRGRTASPPATCASPPPARWCRRSAASDGPLILSEPEQPAACLPGR